jgi:transcription elongation factor Elf1
MLLDIYGYIYFDCILFFWQKLLSNIVDNKFICPICHKQTRLTLYPDWCSSGVWCNSCGINFSRPKNDFPKLPVDLVNAIICWNNYWELYYDYNAEFYNGAYHINDKADGYKWFQKNFLSLGKILAEEVNKYYECILKEDRLFVP